MEGTGKTGFIDDFIKSDDPDSTCLIDQGKIFSYAEIDNLVSRLSSFISDRIRSREARVAIFLPNSWEFFVVLYATIRAGGIAVPIDFRSSTTEVAEILMKTSPELSFVFDGKSHFFDGFNGLRIIVNTSFQEWIESINPVKKKISREESDPAMILFTGGTTGIPKGVVLSHKNINHVVRSLSEIWSLKPGKETFLQLLPATHSGGLNCIMNVAMYSKSKLVIMRKFDLEQMIREIRENKVTVLVAVPTVYNYLNKDDNIGKEDLQSIKVFFSSGAKLLEPTLNKFYEKTGKIINVGWGMTESAPQITVAKLNYYEPDFVGRPLPMTEVRAFDDNGTLLPDGQVGELCVRGPQVMAGYWNDPLSTSNAFTEEGFLKTGDVGYVNEKGVFLLGRKKDVIISGGYKIWRQEVERALLDLKGVKEAAVIGVPDSIYGEIVKAFVVPLFPMQDSDIKEALKEKLSILKIPRSIEFMEAIPKSSAGKIAYRELESYAEGPDKT